MNHRMAPKGARSAYVAPSLDDMQEHLDALQGAVERHCAVNWEARKEIKRLRDLNTEMLKALTSIVAIGSDYGPKDHISRLDGQAILGRARDAVAKAEGEDNGR